MKCPNCDVTLLCGCNACIEKNIARIYKKDVSLIRYVNGHCKACMNCGLMLHEDQWLDKMETHYEVRLQ